MADIQPRFPGPSSVVGVATRFVAWELRVARYMLSVPARLALLLEDAEQLVARINTIADSVDRAVAAVDQIILSAAHSVDEVDATIARVGRTVTRADDAVGAAERIIARVDSTVGDAEKLVLRVDSTADGADQLVRRVERSVGDAEELVLRVDATVDTADELVLRVDATAGRADQLVQRVTPLVEFAETTVAGVRPILEELLLEEGIRAEQARVVAGRVTELLVVADDVATTLVPFVGRVADTVDSEDFEAVLDVIDSLPAIIRSVDTEVLPIIRSLDTVAPELSEILVVANNCLEALNGIPGFQRLRRRGGDSANKLT